MSKICGIDLGTTFSAIAHLNELGRPEVVSNSDGDRILHSAAYFDAKGVVHVGQEAINSRHEDVSRSVRWIKRRMMDPDYKTTIDGKEYTPSELSSFILKKLVQDAVPQIGEVTDVVISIPTNFGEVARKATMDAGKLAGLNVVGIVNEPTAAALYYAMSYKISGRVLIFDLGGGTLDLSIGNIRGKDIQIMASLGDQVLGGFDFDQQLVNFFEDKYRAMTGGELCCAPEERAEVEDYAEVIKKSLSKKTAVAVRLRGDAGSIRFEVLRSDFDKLIASHLARMEMLVESILAEVKLEMKEIQSVLLVGGSSRIPAVQNMLTRLFGYAPSVVGNVDECVCLGAALYAGFRLMEDDPSRVEIGVAKGLGDIAMAEVCNHSYGALAVKLNAMTQKRELVNRFIIPKNTKVPCSVNHTFYTTSDDQKWVAAMVTQGESVDPKTVETVASGKLALPAGRPLGSPIAITYSYDKNQRMKCVFSDQKAGTELQFDLDLKSGETTPRKLQEQNVKLSKLIIE